MGKPSTDYKLKLAQLSGALMIESGLLLHMCVGAMLIMKPHHPKPLRNLRGNDHKELTVRNGMKTQMTSKPDFKRQDSVRSMTGSVLCNFNFILLMINSWMFVFGVGVVYTHILAFVESQGILPSLGNMMISAIGLSSLIGRILLSSLSQHPKINTHVLYVIAVFFCGKYN